MAAILLMTRRQSIDVRQRSPGVQRTEPRRPRSFINHMIILVRHAEAVPRKGWSDDDDHRPLTRRGLAQADGLLDVLEDYDVEQLLCSPAVRCRATLAPLASKRSLTVKTSRRLCEGRGEDALDVVLDAVGDLLVCTHRDVIEDILTGLRRLGWPIPNQPHREKGSTWFLSRESCAYFPPIG
jgi:phosphohistidine phosphatase SixA